MGFLPSLCKIFVELVEILVSHLKENYLYHPFVFLNGLSITNLFGNLHITFWSQKDANLSKRDTLVVLLQDMLEVFTRDMMVNEIRLVNIYFT